MRGGVVVVVAYYVPPAVGIAVQRMEGMLRHLREAGWSPVLVAPESVHYHRAAGPAAEPEGVRVVRVPNPEPSRWLRRLAGAARPGGGGASTRIRELEPVAAGPGAARVRRWVRDWVYVPDAQALWIPAAARAARAAVREAAGRPVVLFSTSVPFSCHFAARRAAHATGVPWVAEYRDPWSTHPNPPQAPSRLRRALDRRLDRAIVNAADALVVTSEATRDLFLSSFPGLGGARIRVVRNGWAPAGEGEEASPDPAGPLRLVYAGSLLDSSWADALLGGMAILAARDPASVTLDVYGAPGAWRDALARAPGGVHARVRMHGLVPGGEVAAILRRASASVVLVPDARVVVPGKLYDAIGARRPVVADLPPGSESAALAGDHGDLRSIHGCDARGAAGVLGGLLDDHRAGRLRAPSVPPERVAALSREAQVRRLASLFDELAAGREEPSR